MLSARAAYSFFSFCVGPFRKRFRLHEGRKHADGRRTQGMPGIPVILGDRMTERELDWQQDMLVGVECGGSVNFVEVVNGGRWSRQSLVPTGWGCRRGKDRP